MVMLGTTTTSQEVNDTPEYKERAVVSIMEATEECDPAIYTVNKSVDANSPRLASRLVRKTPVEVNLDDIIYIEEENELVLGFDTADYLPEDFDPYKQYVDLDAIEFIEEEDCLDLDFDTAEYLPDGFDPYADATYFRHIDFIEEGEDDYSLGFDTAEYLPEGFDPHEFYVDLDAIEYIEEEEDLDYDYLIGYYSNSVFDPFTK